MKIILFLSVVTAVFAVEKETFKLAKEVSAKMKELSTPCADEYNLDHSVILKLPAGTVPDDEAGRNFVYCAASANGFIMEDGHMNEDNVVGLLKDHPLQEQVREAVKKCNEITKENPLATAMAMHKCFAEKSPVRLVL